MKIASSHYENLDNLIIESLKRREVGLMGLFAGAVREECEMLSEALGRESYRVIDGRLSALKKAGKVKYVSGIGWTIA